MATTSFDGLALFSALLNIEKIGALDVPRLLEVHEVWLLLADVHLVIHLRGPAAPASLLRAHILLIVSRAARPIF